MRKVTIILVCLAVFAGYVPLHGHCGTKGKIPGYLAPDAVPDSAAIIPPPPAEGSTAHRLDQEISLHSLGLKGSPHWDLAAEDADLEFPEAFSCALNARITGKDAPRLYRLMQRAMVDVSRSVAGAKVAYGRPRPFMVNGKPTCSPKFDGILSRNGSYPSGHSAIGWAWALILAEIAPDRANAILARGRKFGQGRVVCNVHWQSDVDEGRTVGAAVLARLHAETTFREDLEAARSELAAFRARKVPPGRDCKKEEAALDRAPRPVRPDDK
jgi:acid phosphatase (class A)